MPDEKRYPRERFTNSLLRACKTLCAQPNEIEVVTRALNGRLVLSAKVKLRSLWVVGSYARGAQECGDLDLVFQVDTLSGVTPAAQALAKTIFGHAPLLSFYSGTPEVNSSGVAFQDAHLVWSDIDPDYAKHIAEIPVMPSAGRFERETDSIPLAMRQIRAYSDEVDAILAMKAACVVDWLFIPFTDPPREEQQLEPQLKRKIDAVLHGCGKARNATVRRFLNETHELWTGDSLSSTSRTGLKLGDSNLRVGTPSLPASVLMRCDYAKEILIPLLSPRGPNGAWVITRGANHPLTLQSAKHYAYALMENGKAALWSDVPGPFAKKELHLYHSMELAESSLLRKRKEGMEIGKLSGEVLLSSIARADSLKIWKGKRQIKKINMRDFSCYDCVFASKNAEIFSALMAE